MYCRKGKEIIRELKGDERVNLGLKTSDVWDVKQRLREGSEALEVIDIERHWALDGGPVQEKIPLSTCVICMKQQAFSCLSL